MSDIKLFWGFALGLTDIGDCRVAFATETTSVRQKFYLFLPEIYFLLLTTSFSMNPCGHPGGFILFMKVKSSKYVTNSKMLNTTSFLNNQNMFDDLLIK